MLGQGEVVNVGAPDRHGEDAARGGYSATASAFGARVTLPVEGRSLFFVVAHDGPPDAAIHRAGGRIVARLVDPRHALAIAPLVAHAELRADREVRHAGPVSIDPVRFGRFSEMIGLDRDREA